MARLVLATGGCWSDSKATDLRLLDDDEAAAAAGSVADSVVVESSGSVAEFFPLEVAVARVT